MQSNDVVVPKNSERWRSCFESLSNGKLTLSEWLEFMYNYGQNCRGLPVEGLALMNNASEGKNGNSRCPCIAGKKKIVEKVLSDSKTNAEYCTEQVKLDNDNKCISIFRKTANLETPEIKEFLNLLQSYYLRYLIYRRSIELWGTEQGVILIGSHPTFVDVLEKTTQYANSSYPVLIYGETGTGKELFARTLHILSNNSGPFIPVNCGCMTPQMAYSHLFGHCRGSYTGAHEERSGVFRAAEGGTLFLDEVEALAPDLQAMLLRALDYGEITPLGSDFPQTICTRIITATNQDFDNLISSGQFRLDLLYRLRTQMLNLPSLKSRGKADILEIANVTLNVENTVNGVNKNFEESTLHKLTDYQWPGNIRELKNNIIESFYTSGINNNPVRIINNLTLLKTRDGNDKNTYHDIQIDKIIEKILVDKSTFWDAVRTPYLQRKINRYQVRQIIKIMQKQSNCFTYKKLIKFFNLEECEYKKFINFINKHNLNP